VFDLDGVLIDSRELHYVTLNEALTEVGGGPRYAISRDEHLATYDGLPTTRKLHMLTDRKQLPRALHDAVWRMKQERTLAFIRRHFKPDARLQHMMWALKARGYTIHCASNSVYATVKTALLYTGLLDAIDWFASNEEVRHPKPAPDIYLKCIARAGVSCHDTLVCEDSPVGRRAALASGAHLCPIAGPDDVTLQKVLNAIAALDGMAPGGGGPKWLGPLNVVVPMAGLGSRFAAAGYTFPKPLIDVHGKPMIQWVTDNLPAENATFIFVVQASHRAKYSLDAVLANFAPHVRIVEVDGVTEGAACSILLARALIDNDTPLLLANSDQFLEWDFPAFMYRASAAGVDGCISTFHNTHPKWSYARLDDAGLVTEVAEKRPISTHATTGVYYWRRGADFVHYADAMIAKGVRVNGEFYTAPVFNEAIADGKKIATVPADRMWGLGTPEDLKTFLKEYAF